MMNKYDKVHDAFEKCAKEHLNSMEIKGRVYRPGIEQNEFANVLEEVVRPVYLSAKNSIVRLENQNYILERH